MQLKMVDLSLWRDGGLSHLRGRRRLRRDIAQMDSITGTTQREFLELAELGGAAGAPPNVAGVVNLDEAPELALVAVIAALAAK